MRLAVCFVLALAFSAPCQQQPATEAQQTADRIFALGSSQAGSRAIEDEKIPWSHDFLRALQSRADRLLARGNLDEAAAWYDLLITKATGEGFEREYATIRTSQAQLARRRGDLELALLRYQDALPRVAGKDNLDLVRSSIEAGLCITYRQLGRLDEAIASGKQAVQAAGSVAPSQGPALNSLAVAYRERGDFRLALEYLLKSLAVAEKLTTKDGQAFVLNNIGSVYHDQGDIDQGIEYYLRSFRIKETLADKSTLSTTAANLATAFADQGNLQQAELYARRALSLSEQSRSPQDEGIARATLATVEERQGRHLAAIEDWRRSIQIFDNRQQRVRIAALTRLLGQSQRASGDQAAALASFEQSRDLARSQGERYVLYEALTELGNTLRAANRRPEARTALTEAADILRQMRNEVAGGAVAEQRFLSRSLSPYRSLAAMAAEDGNATEAFRLLELSRTQVLLDWMQQGRVPLSRLLTPTEKQQERSLSARLAVLNARGRASEDLRKARLEWDAFETGVFAAHPELKRERLAVDPPLDGRAAMLPQKTALLSYLSLPEETWAFLLRPGDKRPQAVRLGLTERSLRAETDKVIAAISAKSLGYRSSAQAVYARLLAPVLTKIGPAATTLVIVPDGPLWRLPFAALESAAGKSLMESYALFTVASATVLRELISAPRPSQSLLAFGNPTGSGLVDAESEVRSLATIYAPGRATILTQAQATESLFKAQAGQYDVVHLASHAVLQNRNPMYSYLRLTAGAGEDGFLEARELLSMKLRAGLVVLSACETAGGAESNAEGLIGLTWALALAGSPATVASGWKVDSAATSAFMTAMHRGLRSGMTKSAALRAAGLELRSKPATRHPYYWAAFTLFGHGF